MAYFWGWTVCLLATLVVIACGFWMTRRWRPLFLRDLVRLFAVATLLVPVTAGSFGGFYAPAYIVLVFEAFLQREGDPIPALTALTLAWSGALLVTVGLQALRAVRASRAQV
ncbi:MAG: hypothetical protein V2J24_23110 [Pseudomonadales bacterium]|jgi:hypothetical protein|nr:hypothetical protein [Pseudomonadales bacterium]